MEATSSNRRLIDIPATVKKHTDIVTNLLTMHCLSGCDTIGQMYGIGKGKTLRSLTAGYSLCKLGCIDASISYVITEVTQFIGPRFGSKKEDMSEIRVEMWAKTMSKKRVTSAPELKSLPPTSEAFAQNVRRAHFQAAIWRSAVSSHPPDMDATQYGWSNDLASKTLVPVTVPSDVALVPSYVLEMISCKCASKEPCQNAQCGCDAAHLPCTFFFCACCADPHVCNNPFNKRTVENDENEDDDDGGNDEGDVS